MPPLGFCGRLIISPSSAYNESAKDGDRVRFRIGREGMALCILTAALCAVFALSVQMYDRLESETADGALAAAASAARHFLGENDAVAAFLGMPDRADSEQTDTADLPNAAQEDARVQAEADAYILRYNRIYANLR